MRLPSEVKVLYGVAQDLLQDWDKRGMWCDMEDNMANLQRAINRMDHIIEGDHVTYVTEAPDPPYNV